MTIRPSAACRSPPSPPAKASSEQADAAGGVWTVIGYRSFAEQRLDDGRSQQFRSLFQFLSRVQCAAAGQDRDFFPAIQNVGGSLPNRRRSGRRALRASTSEVWCGMLRWSACLLLNILFLKVDWKGDVRNAAVGKSGSARQLSNILNMRGAHDALVVTRRHPCRACRAPHPAV